MSTDDFLSTMYSACCVIRYPVTMFILCDVRVFSVQSRLKLNFDTWQGMKLSPLQVTSFVMLVSEDPSKF